MLWVGTLDRTIQQMLLTFLPVWCLRSLYNFEFPQAIVERLKNIEFIVHGRKLCRCLGICLLLVMRGLVQENEERKPPRTLNNFTICQLSGIFI